MASADTPRRAGVLLHPTSLPGSRGQGALGAAMGSFIEFMQRAGLRVWQMLPLGPVHADRSPYRALSLNAGGEHLICLRHLRAERWMRRGRGWGRPTARARFLRLAAQCFARHASPATHAQFKAFAQHHRDWLEPYCAFRVLRRQFRGAPWQDWPAYWRDNAAEAFARLSEQAPESLEREKIIQFLFERQWHALRKIAAAKRITLFGDLPFYPALDSVDVWYHRSLFQLDAHGRPLATAGVPPDAFAPLGQAWGAALYDWERMAADDFAWWRARMRVQGERFDLLRLDHFRGFEAYWAIPAGTTPPGEGRWCPGPGAALLSALRAEPGLPPLVAEDLGMITPEVEALRREFALPGTRVLRFAFDGDPANPHLPRNHEADAVVCTGTHDNDTLAGWWRRLDAATREQVRETLGLDDTPSPERLLDALMASPAALAIVPMQDVLGLGSGARMNVPGRAEGNWRWRLRRDQMAPETALHLHDALRRSGRA